MTKRIGRSNRTAIFPISSSNDPFTNLLSAGANIVVSHGLKRLSHEVGGLLGTNGPSAQDQIALNSSRIQLQKQETEYIRVKALTERQIRLQVEVIDYRDGKTMGRFRVTEVRQEEYYAEGISYVDPVWSGLVRERGETTVTPWMIAMHPQGGGQDGK